MPAWPKCCLNATRDEGSIRDRLLNKTRAEKPDYNRLLTRYALERLLYRLSISTHRDQFLLKGVPDSSNRA